VKTSSQRILTTHAGSLVRSVDVVEANIRKMLGNPIPDAEVERALTEGVRDVVKKQADIGIDIIDDGEFGKANWIGYLVERLEGVEPVQLALEDQAKSAVYPDKERLGEFYEQHIHEEYIQWVPNAPSKPDYVKAARGFNGGVFTGPIRYKPEAVDRDIANMKAAVQGLNVEEVFMPVVAPCSVEAIRNEYYKSQEEFLFAVADALNEEYRRIVDAGFLLQVDDAILPMQRFARFPGADKYDDYVKWATIRMEALNQALKGIPEEKVRYHLCFGSHNVPHISDPTLKELIGLILKANAQAYSIEASNPRHEHEWKLWEEVKLPDGKILIPGVVGHATNVVEHPELVAMRLVNFASLVGRERVIGGTDCGFSQGWNIVRVHESVQWAKLEALVEGARLASDYLWKK
jgi:5-methyltetrahydropteroyltriglutamate--homocysteine methyltransferase